MSKAGISKTKSLAESYRTLETVFGLEPNTYYRGELFIVNATAEARIADNATGADYVPVATGTNFYHLYSAVNVSTVWVYGNASDTVTLVGENVIIGPNGLIQ